MTYQWLLFDADRTLFDYDRGERNALHNTFETFGISFHPDIIARYAVINNAVWEIFEKGGIDQITLRTRRFELLFNEIGVQGINLPAFSALYLKNLSEQAALLPGVMKLLDQLAGNYKMVIITNGLSEVQKERFKRFPQLSLFEKVFISEEIGYKKPDPAFFQHVFDHIGNPSKNEALVIGDSLGSDMRGANNFGLDACWVNPKGAEVPEDLVIKYQVKSVSEITGFLN